MSHGAVQQEIHKLSDHFNLNILHTHLIAFYVNDQVSSTLFLPFLGFKLIKSHTGMHNRLIYFTLLSKKTFQRKFPNKDTIDKITWQDVVSHSRT